MVAFFKTDAISAYNQILLARESRPILAVWTPIGLIQPTRLPFGVINAGTVLQRKMSKLRQQLSPEFREQFSNYADDFTGGVKDITRLVPFVRDFLNVCRKNKITLGPKKTEIGYPRTVLLGYDIGV